MPLKQSLSKFNVNLIGEGASIFSCVVKGIKVNGGVLYASSHNTFNALVVIRSLTNASTS